VVEGCRKLVDKELRNPYTTPDIKEDEMGGHVALIREMRNAYKILVGISEWKR
jgi:hypothetical protein